MENTNRYYNNKPWLTNAMKDSIKMKNKLYIIRNKANAPDGRNGRYRMYRNKLNHILRSAERKYYQDLLIEHKTNVKFTVGCLCIRYVSNTVPINL